MTFGAFFIQIIFFQYFQLITEKHIQALLKKMEPNQFYTHTKSNHLKTNFHYSTISSVTTIISVSIVGNNIVLNESAPILCQQHSNRSMHCNKSQFLKNDATIGIGGCSK